MCAMSAYKETEQKDVCIAYTVQSTANACTLFNTISVSSSSSMAQLDDTWINSISFWLTLVQVKLVLIAVPLCELPQNCAQRTHRSQPE